MRLWTFFDRGALSSQAFSPICLLRKIPPGRHSLNPLAYPFRPFSTQRSSFSIRSYGLFKKAVR